MSNAVSFNNVSIVFGNKPGDALPLMDAGQSRAEIEAATGQVLGVHNCTLDVAEGEILVLMGLSGSGKSTLLRAVNGLNPVVRGHVEVNDGSWSANVQTCSANDLRKVRRECVSMVFQQFGLLPWRTVRDNVALALELSQVPKKDRLARADEQLALVGLSDWADRKVGELSGGMQQRVGLARAFVTQAPILLMDEPFSALDPLIRTRKYMEDQGVWDDKKQEELETRAQRIVKEVVDAAINVTPPEKTEFFDDMYAELPEDLRIQRETMRTSSIGRNPSQIGLKAQPTEAR